MLKGKHKLKATPPKPAGPFVVPRTHPEERAARNGKAGTGGTSAGHGHRTSSAFAAKLRLANQGGEPLPEDIRRDMSGKAGQDLGGVRIHRGADSASAADAINAEAFTHGAHIHFNRNAYAPGSPAGNKLLEHELMHVVQQVRSPGTDRIHRQEKEEERSVLQHTGDFFVGAYEGGTDMVKGVATLAEGAYDISALGAVTHPEDHERALNTLFRVGDAVKENHGVLVDAFTAPYEKAIEEGKPMKAVGRGAVDVASVLVGTKGLDKVGKAGVLSKASAATSRVMASKPVQKVAEVSRKIAGSAPGQILARAAAQIDALAATMAEQLYVLMWRARQNMPFDDARYLIGVEAAVSIINRRIDDIAAAIANGTYEGMAGLGKLSPGARRSLADKFAREARAKVGQMKQRAGKVEVKVEVLDVPPGSSTKGAWGDLPSIRGE